MIVSSCRSANTFITFPEFPFTSRTHLEGHAVRAMYACCGAGDYYLETGDAAYLKTLDVLWDDLVSAQMYVTGGVGARAQGEAFGEAYELRIPPPTARVARPSATLMWNWRMLAATGRRQIRRRHRTALYNGINSGHVARWDRSIVTAIRWVSTRRVATRFAIRGYDTTCCPPNLERTFASLPGYFYSTSKDGLYVHLYDNSLLDWHLEDGTGLKVVQKQIIRGTAPQRLPSRPRKPTEFTFIFAFLGGPMDGGSPSTESQLPRRSQENISLCDAIGLRAIPSPSSSA